jgi:hypothetical protein
MGGLRLLAVTIALTPSPALAKAEWRFVSSAAWEGDKTHCVLQVDKASLRRTDPNALYWVRVASAESEDIKWTSSEFASRVQSGPSLHENNCASSRFRLIQGRTAFEYDGSFYFKLPAEWQYIEPDSVAEKVHSFVCGARGGR